MSPGWQWPSSPLPLSSRGGEGDERHGLRLHIYLKCAIHVGVTSRTAGGERMPAEPRQPHFLSAISAHHLVSLGPYGSTGGGAGWQRPRRARSPKTTASLRLSLLLLASCPPGARDDRGPFHWIVSAKLLPHRAERTAFHLPRPVMGIQSAHGQIEGLQAGVVYLLVRLFTGLFWICSPSAWS